eukprot:199348-Rhodomonas_salina.1
MMITDTQLRLTAPVNLNGGQAGAGDKRRGWGRNNSGAEASHVDLRSPTPVASVDGQDLDRSPTLVLLLV